MKLKLKKVIALVSLVVMPLATQAEACGPSQQGDKKGGDKQARIAAGQTMKVSPGWRWKQEKATKDCKWQLLVDKNDRQYIERGAGGKKFGWIKVTAITDPKYKGARQYIKSNRACGWWIGEKTK